MNNNKSQIIVKNQIINVIIIDNKEYISLTDLARYADDQEPKLPIYSWMRNKDVIAYLGLWEKLHNNNFKGHEFETFEKEAGSNRRKKPQRERLIKLNNIAKRQMELLTTNKKIKELERIKKDE